MDAINGATALTEAPRARSGNAFADLGSDDFLKLMITQLANQDPLEPTGNEELLRQISSIREIELSTTLTESLRQLTGQQNLGSASALIGQYVTGLPGEDGSATRGLVVGVRFGEGGRPLLMLSNGGQLALEQVAAIQPPIQAARSLEGQVAVGLDTRDPRRPQLVDGVVTGSRVDEEGEVVLELDTGGNLRLRDVLSAASADEG